MNHSTSETVEKLRVDERIMVSAGFLITSVMMTCLLACLVQIGELAAPGWNGTYLILVGFLVALESLYSHRLLYHLNFTDPKFIIYRLTEWVIILVLLKIIQLINSGLEGGLAEMFSWQRDFFLNFFTNETIFGLISIAIAWVISGKFALELIPLEANQHILRLEIESGLYDDRSAIRQRLGNLIMLVGGGMVVITALLRNSIVSNWFELPSMRASVGYTILYFFLGLVLLSLTQYNLLRAQWFRDALPVRKDIAGRWLLYSLLFLFILALIARLLPTNYSINLLSVLQYLFYVIVSILNLIITLLILPILWVIALLASLFGGESEITRAPMVPSMSDINALVPSESIPWWELVKSIFFWVALLGIVGFSIVYFFRENRELWRKMKAMPLLSAVMRFFDWFWSLLRGMNRRIIEVIDAGWARLRSRRAEFELVRPWQYRNPHRLHPRERVRFYYLAMVRRGSEQGHRRQPAQTPLEYSKQLAERLDSGISTDVSSSADHPFSTDIRMMTDKFIHARYSQQEITEFDASLVQRAWQNVRRAFRR